MHLRRFSLVAVVVWLTLVQHSKADEPAPFGLAKRVPWTSSRITGSPDPPSRYRVEVAFPNLKFNEPLDMTRAPDGRLYVAERFGKIYGFEPKSDVVSAELLLDLGKVIYGVAFHPKFQENGGYMYVTYVLDAMKEEPRGTRVSRFHVAGKGALRADPTSERVILEWPSGGHNGGCLQFGPDGYLYIATGDSSGIADERITGQDISDLSGAILRIDVDHQDIGDAYSIPKDNPFVNVPGARPEVWAYGLRQPWKFTFDHKTGELWCGNVGQDLWEQIFLIERGGNYGWSVMEGSHPFRPERLRGPSPFVSPIVEHNHTDFRSITGGFVYHGTRLPELTGSYIYGDYDTGKIWMLRYDRESKKVTQHEELVDSSLRIVGFGEDQSGEIYMVDHVQGRLFRLQRNEVVNNAAEFPRQLSQTGLFASVARHLPAAGVIHYAVNAPQWCDGAQKERFLALPGDSQIEFDGITYPQPAPGAPHGWKFPNGTVAFETLSLEMEQGNPASRRRLETRVLHYEKLAGSEEVGDQYWNGYTYIWNDDQTDAVLLEDPYGADRKLAIQDPSAPGGVRQQTWHFPARSECIVCHNMAAKYVLGINTLQMNRTYNYGDVEDNQIRAWEHAGCFTAPLPADPQSLPRLVDYADGSFDVNQRARSYLHANCSHCHRKWGGGNAEFRLLATIDAAEMGIISVRPAHGAWYIPDAEIVAPGDPYRSVLNYRMSKLGPGRMPRIGSTVVDERGLALIHEWITQLPSEQPNTSGPQSASELAAVEALKALVANQGAPAEQRQPEIQQLLQTTVGALQLMHAIDDGSLDQNLLPQTVALASAEETPSHVRDLFERFIPEEDRIQRLGAVVRPDEILNIPGDVERGRTLFAEAAGVQCRNCHQIGGVGKEVGPELTKIGEKMDRAKILDTILNPSKEIDPKFTVYLVESSDGQVYSGLLVERTAEHVVLKDAEGKLIELATDEVDQLLPQQQSIMPDLLLRDLTAEQVADLTAFLSSLK